jgi:hypothetical protein
MKRIYKDYRTITDDHMTLIKRKYPNGFSDSDLIALKTSDGNYFDALEIESPDVVYIIKVNHDLLEAIDQYEERDFSDEVEAEEAEENEA